MSNEHSAHPPRLRVLFVTFEAGVGGPQRWLDDVLEDETFQAAIDARVWNVEDLYRGEWGKFRLLRECRRQLRMHQPQRVYLSHDLNVAALAVVCFRVLGAPRTLVHSHNARYYDDEKGWKPRLYRALVRASTDTRIALSPEAAVAMYGDPPGTWAQIADFIDFEKLWRESEQPPGRRHDDIYTFGCVGRLCHQKNQELVIRAIAAVRDSGVAARLLLLGAGPMEQSFRELVHTLRLGDAVEFVGNADCIGSWYRHAFDALVVPSRFEGQGRMVAEAQLFGLPVIASAAVPEMAYLRKDERILMQGLELHEWTGVMQRLATVRPPRAAPDLRAALAHASLSMSSGIPALVETIQR